MRNLLRSWLGVERLERKLQSVKQKAVNDARRLHRQEYLSKETRRMVVNLEEFLGVRLEPPKED